MSNYSLNLKENAISTLEEALLKLSDALDGDEKAYKFAILHFSSYVELLFKLYIQGIHELLVYQSVFKGKLNFNQDKNKPKTITFWDAVNFIENEGKVELISRKDLEWLKDLRNDIEHFEFDFSKQDAIKNIEKIYSAIESFPNCREHLTYFSNRAYRATFDRVIEGQRQAYKDIEDGIKAKRKASGDAYFEKFVCNHCDKPFLIKNPDSCSGYRCESCQNENVTKKICNDCGLADESSVLTIVDEYIEWRCYPYCCTDLGLEVLDEC